MEKISVCMASYNGGKFIRKQIESILSQLGRDDELIISDDSSTDDTCLQVSSFHDKRILLLQDNNFHNPIYNFENALKHASGDYIFLTDQDDFWHESKVTTILQLLHIYDLVVSDCIIIDENDNIINSSFFKLNGSGSGLFRNIIKNKYLGCCMAFRKSMLVYALPFPAAIPMHDMWLGTLAELKGTTYFCSDKLVYYRRHKANLSSASEKSYYGLVDKIKFRYNLISALITRCVLNK